MLGALRFSQIRPQAANPSQSAPVLSAQPAGAAPNAAPVESAQPAVAAPHPTPAHSAVADGTVPAQLAPLAEKPTLAAADTRAEASAVPFNRQPGAMRRTLGTIGTAVGVALGRTLPSLALGVGTGLLVASTPLGPIGGAVVGLLAFGGAAVGEYFSKAGRVVGGWVGGALGVAAGQALGTLRLRPPEALARETADFKLKDLKWKLRDTDYTSHRMVCFDGKSTAALEQARYGDVVVIQDDSDGYGFKTAGYLQKAVGKSGAWTHLGIVDRDGKIRDIMGGSGPQRRDKQEYLYHDHIAILRPRYLGEQSIDRTIAHLDRIWNSVSYDERLSLKSDDEQYCTEFIYKALREGAPEIGIEPTKRFGFKFVNADDFFASKQIDVVYNSGSNFWLNHLSHYD